MPMYGKEVKSVALVFSDCMYRLEFVFTDETKATKELGDVGVKEATTKFAMWACAVRMNRRKT